MVESHNYETAEKNYTITPMKHTAPQLGSEVQGFFKQQGIDMGNILNRDHSWTKYQVYGTKEPAEIADGELSVVEVYISVKHKAILPTRTFRNDDKLYKFPPEKRLPMSEFFFQLWKNCVKDGKADYGVEVNIGDLEKVIILDVDNAETKAIVSKAQQVLGDNKQIFSIKPQDETAFNAFAASSSGVSTFHMLADHNGVAELKNLQPSQVDVAKFNKLPVIDRTLSRS